MQIAVEREAGVDPLRVQDVAGASSASVLAEKVLTGSPRHDWMTKLEGPAAYRALQEFDRRWGMAGKGRLRLVPFNRGPGAGRLFVQTSHTYPIAFGGGNRQILAAYEHAISKARHYAYFENQYWRAKV